MTIITKIKEAVRKLFPIKSIKSKLQVETAVSGEMIDALNLWSNMYAGAAPWVNDDVHSLHIEQGIVREFANVVLSEMQVSVSNILLDRKLKYSLRNFNEHFQSGLAYGAFVIKPVNGDRVQFINQNRFIPLEFVDNKMTKVIFPEVKKAGDKHFYVRLEMHDFEQGRGLIIRNKAFYTTTLEDIGKEISLADVPEWADLEPEIAYPLAQRPIYGYYRNPIENTIDASPCGVSIFGNAVNLIKDADVQYGRLNWEFESGERAIHVDPAALQPTPKKGIDGKFTLKLPKLNKRLYRAVDVQLEGKELFSDFSPELREASIINGLEEIKRNIEFNVGLSYGDLSKPQSIEKTATEIINAKKRKYNTVNAIQQNLKECLDDFVYALAFFNSLATSNYTFFCDFKDSILTDEETERKHDLQDVASGIMNPWEFRMKWYGEDEKTAKAMLPETARLIE